MERINTSKNITWINLLKALCMAFVYLDHSEVYYGINSISYGPIFKPFYVNAFFFVSGYLFFRKQLQTVGNYGIIDLWKNLKTIIFRLVIPTIVFASIIYIPKLFFHNKIISIYQYFYDVFGGISFWFTSTIIVAQIILIILLLSRKNNIWFYFAISCILFILSIYINTIFPSPFPWFYKSGLCATFFLAIGGIYSQYEKAINNYFNSLKSSLLIILYIICTIYNLNHNEFHYVTMTNNFNLIGILISILGIAFITIICKQLPQFKILEYIGKNSIVFYFFSGALPASIGLIFQKIFPEKTYIITLTVALLSIFTGYLLTYVVVKYLPWLTDFRKLKK